MPPIADASRMSEGEDPAPDTEGEPWVWPDGKEIVCGPLLNYRRMAGSRWHGSALIVTSGGGKTQSFVPILRLAQAKEWETGQTVASEAGTDDAASGQGDCGSSVSATACSTEIQGVCLYSDPRNTFWAFNLEVGIADTETQWEYEIPGMRFADQTKPRRYSFFVPAVTESFRILFYSCNDFGDEVHHDDWSTPALWNDVLRRHTANPWNVMIGGGDQIYNDGVGVHGPLRPWTDIRDPNQRRQHPFPEELRKACDDYYLNNYIKWYSTEPFASVTGQIPQLNIWDDHDIIDGYGSYVDEFMNCDVFKGIGSVAYKYYMLFQHHLPPPQSTYSTQGDVRIKLRDTFVAPRRTELGYVLGPKPGPYISELSHSIFARLGARIAFLGIDARTERSRHQINFPETYDLLFSRLQSELESAKGGGQPYKHLILLLGIPVAYPRLTCLETLFRSRLIGPLRFLNQKFGVGRSIFNQFDGSVELLDDLEDHYTAKTHKEERNALIKRLQKISAAYSVRITILGGDVHLAALGRFCSATGLRVPVENDHRYIVNVISSGIASEPPPRAIANLLVFQNRIHHLDPRTEETLLNVFNKDPGSSSRTAWYNNVTMPSRNFSMITENSPNNSDVVPPAAADDGTVQSRNRSKHPLLQRKDGQWLMRAGEVGAGTEHKAASRRHGQDNDGSLDICFCVEMSRQDREGRTESYGVTVPTLTYEEPRGPER